MPEDFVSNSASTTESVAPATPSTQPEGTVATESSAVGGGVSTQVEDSSVDSSSTDTTTSAVEGSEGFKNLRSSYQTLKANYEALKAQTEQSPDSYLSLDAPVDDWAISDQLDAIKTNAYPYYNKMAWEIMDRHLPEVLPYFLENQNSLPADMKPLVEASAVAIVQTYTGLTPEQIGEAVRQYKAGQGMGFQNPSYPSNTPSTDVATIAYQNNLDVNDPDQFRMAQQFANQQRQLAQLTSQINDLTQSEQSRATTLAQQKVDSQVGGFKNDFLSKVKVPAGYEHISQEISDRLDLALSRDPEVQRSIKALQSFYRQGTPDLRAVSTEVAKIQRQMAVHVKSISEPRLAEIQQLETFKTTTSQAQSNVRNLAPGLGTAAPSTAHPNRAGVSITPQNAGDLAVASLRAARTNKPNIP